MGILLGHYGNVMYPLANLLQLAIDNGTLTPDGFPLNMLKSRKMNDLRTGENAGFFDPVNIQTMYLYYT